MPTIDEARRYLGIDYTDEVVDANILRALNDAAEYLKSAVGEDIFELLPDDRKVDRLVLAYTQELYDERGVSAKAGNAKREMIHSMELQLRLELARAREGAATV